MLLVLAAETEMKVSSAREAGVGGPVALAYGLVVVLPDGLSSSPSLVEGGMDVSAREALVLHAVVLASDAVELASDAVSPARAAAEEDSPAALACNPVPTLELQHSK